MATTQRTLAGRIGAHARWAKETDPKAATAPARRGWFARFERQVDPDGVLSPAERDRRAKHAMSEYMARLALARETARRARITPPDARSPKRAQRRDGGSAPTQHAAAS